MSPKELLPIVTAAVLSYMQAGNENFTWGETQKEPYLLDDTTIVVPPYSDGFMGFGHMMIWFDNRGMIIVRNCYGRVQKFSSTNLEFAIAFMLEC